MFYNDQWGTVCDDLFYAAEANVICYMLNFTQGAVCSVGGALFGQGQGIPIRQDYSTVHLKHCDSSLIR